MLTSCSWLRHRKLAAGLAKGSQVALEALVLQFADCSSVVGYDSHQSRKVCYPAADTTDNTADESLHVHRAVCSGHKRVADLVECGTVSNAVVGTWLPFTGVAGKSRGA